MHYVDGYVLPLHKKHLETYRRIAKQASAIWKKHGALEYRECIGEDLKVKPGCGVPFPRLSKAKSGETVVFAYIVYKSRAHRDRVNAKVMKDPKLAAIIQGATMPFEMKRMAYGGFTTIVEA